jgi:hypothetical protein
VLSVATTYCPFPKTCKSILHSSIRRRFLTTPTANLQLPCVDFPHYYVLSVANRKAILHYSVRRNPTYCPSTTTSIPLTTTYCPFQKTCKSILHSSVRRHFMTTPTAILQLPCVDSPHYYLLSLSQKTRKLILHYSVRRNPTYCFSTTTYCPFPKTSTQYCILPYGVTL